MVKVSDNTYRDGTFGQIVLSMRATLGPGAEAGERLDPGDRGLLPSGRRGHALRLGPRAVRRRRYQCTPFMRLAIATCSIEAFSLGSFSPRAAAESGKTL